MQPRSPFGTQQIEETLRNAYVGAQGFFFDGVTRFVWRAEKDWGYAATIVGVAPVVV